MEFTQIAYCCTVPFLLLFSWMLQTKRSIYFINLLAVSNLLLIGYAVFLIRQLIGLYQLGRQLHLDHSQVQTPAGSASLRLLLVIVLPFLSLSAWFRKSLTFSMLLLLLLYWNNPVVSWNTFDLFTKIPVYLSLFCAAYALLWLLNKLPYQTRVI